MSDSEYEYEYEYSDADECSDYPVDDSDDDDMEWDGVNDNPNPSPVILGTIKEAGIRMLPAEDVIPEMKRCLEDATEILGVPAAAVAVLLREYKWSKEILLEKFYSNSDKLEKKLGVYARCNPVPMKKSSKTCKICYDDEFPMIAMPCGHEFCTGCWKEFVDNAISEGPSCIQKTCPEANCSELMSEIEVRVAAPNSLPKFESYQLRSFVESNTLTRWCPGPGCERIACASSTLAMEQANNVAHCDLCDISFCAKCAEEPHSPANCKDLARWNEKCKNESETANWILANTKSCPKCSSRIEKNQGCNHMTCQKCKHEFCWICMQDWSEHGANTGGYYKCNKFDTSGTDENDVSDAAKAKRELDRYLHYYKRYHAHSEAQAFAKKQLKETDSRMILLQESSDNARWSDVEFLKTANEQLIECRRVLKYTYTFAYYLTDESKKLQKECFEYHQEMLERFTENLSGLSEKPLAEMDRTDVVNQTRVVDRFMKNILKYVDDGMEDIQTPMIIS
mmetsp:Transcript_26262/g.29052  ORF Transcript_26262/g.29052 Transcript_26262/m.29052 type:complete len:509 (-) Transcript_26262:99-1625(-)|eukprot:CAMPEP_0194130014 /NCGR_PEP_ID=MMETSP0152-20130528/1186_1 /TAXON_ID=1049557 /ORGANISM="Thalassiothrix antarctica, Strain L6-D1" /LENGTH=508 /DNA_ID=CAMNT_0038824421 /DNA_START=127 /DNA_END=1653 /DNA_ORIENTATION=-